MGHEAKDDPSKDFSTVNGTGIGHEASVPASYDNDDDDDDDDDDICTQWTTHCDARRDSILWLYIRVLSKQSTVTFVVT